MPLSVELAAGVEAVKPSLGDDPPVLEDTVDELSDDALTLEVSLDELSEVASELRVLLESDDDDGSVAIVSSSGKHKFIITWLSKKE